jgi:hypothetical protein
MKAFNEKSDDEEIEMVCIHAFGEQMMMEKFVVSLLILWFFEI